MEKDIIKRFFNHDPVVVMEFAHTRHRGEPTGIRDFVNAVVTRGYAYQGRYRGETYTFWNSDLIPNGLFFNEVEGRSPATTRRISRSVFRKKPIKAAFGSEANFVRELVNSGGYLLRGAQAITRDIAFSMPINNVVAIMDFVVELISRIDITKIDLSDVIQDAQRFDDWSENKYHNLVTMTVLRYNESVLVNELPVFIEEDSEFNILHHYRKFALDNNRPDLIEGVRQYTDITGHIDHIILGREQNGTPFILILDFKPKYTYRHIDGKRKRSGLTPNLEFHISIPQQILYSAALINTVTKYYRDFLGVDKAFTDVPILCGLFDAFGYALFEPGFFISERGVPETRLQKFIALNLF